MEYSNNYNQVNPPVINDALNEGLMEVRALEAKLSSTNLPEKLREETMIRVLRLERMFKLGGYSAEFETVSKYVDWITRIPWGVLSEDNLDIHRAKQVMDETHYGMETIKDLILDYIATMQLQSAGGVEKL